MHKQSITLVDAVIKLSNYVRNEKYEGYDPFDSLSSPIFKLPILRSNKLLRFGFQQVFRRLPINLRPLLGIKKGLNPVTLGLAIQSFTYLSQIYEDKKDFYLGEIDYCFDKLVELKSQKYSGACWGYNFDWEHRYVRINAFVPTVVATGIITNGLYEYYKIYKDKKVKEIILDSTQFILKDLNRTYEEKDFCVSYSPNDQQIVFNATMKGARLLSQAYTIQPNEELKKDIFHMVNFVMKHQSQDGYWSYAHGDARTWIDNFHTAYVLDALKVVNSVFDNKYKVEYDKGLSYYLRTFFNEKGETKYFSHKKHPIDATEIAQSIITLSENNYLELAEKVITFGIDNLYSYNGYFYYRKYRFLTDKTSYMRWSNMWMFLAFSIYLSRENDENNMV